jgi:adenylate cyclase
VSDEASIPAADVQAQLERVLASKGFTGAGRLSRMLRYLVERTLAGEGGELKEYAVGVDVFDRGENFDPRIDSIVRVEAGRLRSKIDEYYNAEGAQDGVLISLPRGGYVPQFERRPAGAAILESAAKAAAPAQHASGWATRSLTIGALALAVVVIASLAAWRAQPDTAAPGGVTIAVLAFEQYGSDAVSARLAAEITDGVTAELARLGTVGVVSHTSAMQFAGVRKPLREIAQALNAGVIMEGSVVEEGDGLRVTGRMVDPVVDRKIWVGSFPGNRAELQDLERRIAAAASVAALTRRPTR